MYKRCSILKEIPTRTSGSTAAMQQIPKSSRLFYEDPAYYERQRREFIQRCEPYVRVMMDLRNLQAVRYQVLEAGGILEVEVLWNEGHKELYDQCQAMIDFIRQQYTTKGGTDHAAGTD